MTHARIGPPAIDPPDLPVPQPFRERRVSLRRAADRSAHRETVLLARSLDLLAADGDARSRLAAVLGLIAATVGARRTAVVAGDADRRVVVLAAPGESAEDAERLGAWLDATAPRTRADRAGSGRAPIAVVVADDGDGDRTSRAAAREPHYRCVAVRSAGGVAFGFEFGRRVPDRELAERLPPRLTRHAAVVLALVVRQLAVETELGALRAREAERAQFVSTVAHELRTPLTGLNGYLELILSGRVDDPSVERDFLSRCRGIATTMDELVGDLLELSRLQAGSIRLDLSPFSVAAVCQRAVETLEPIAERRGIHLRPDLPARLRSATGDARRVEQIVTNLVANALKFSPQGSTIELAARYDGSVAVIAVRDEGPGIAPDDRGRIFERFYRLAAHDGVTGTGLGLSIARDLARAMGGDLDVASVPGSGSSFLLALPGPAAVTAEQVAEGLARAVAVEEQRLEEGAVLRAIRIAGGPLPRPRLVPHPSAAGDAANGSRSVNTPPDGRRPVRLRSIDGLAPRSPDPAPA